LRASQSIPLNIAEGNGKASDPDYTVCDGDSGPDSDTDSE